LIETHGDVDLEAALGRKLFGELLGLLSARSVNLALKSLTLILHSLLLLPFSQLLGLDASTLGAVCGVLLLPANVGFVHKLTTASNNLPACVGCLALLLGGSNSSVESSGASLGGGGGDRGVEVVDSVVKSNGEVSKTCADYVSSWALEGSGGISLGRGRESIVLEGDGLADVVDGDNELSTTASSHEELLQSLLVGLPRSTGERLDEVKNVSE
jgi:hypothetical protein